MRYEPLANRVVFREIEESKTHRDNFVCRVAAGGRV